GNTIYNNAKAVDYILHEEGMVKNSSGSFTYEYYLKDHLGNTRVVFNSSGTIEQSTDYYPFGLAFQNNNLDVNKYLYNGKELQDETLGGTFLGWLDYGARFYDPQIARWHVQDRFAEKCLNLSPYQYATNNPILFIDINGDSTFVTMNKNGTYKVVGGNLAGDDNGIYVIGKDGKPGELIGYSATPESFYFSEEGTWQGTINPNDQSGRVFLNKEIVAKDPSLVDYMPNATGGKPLDFKRTNGTDRPIYITPEEFYRGMPILDKKNGKPIFASARDVGNIAAGIVAGRAGLDWNTARLGLDGLESIQQGRFAIESSSTQYGQRLGFRIGSQMHLKYEVSRLPSYGELRNIQISKDVIKRSDFKPR
ncbi:MAG TPA: RHS repeat-associated core domain-containing protein, partial [Bacteroidales bacterium]